MISKLFLVLAFVCFVLATVPVTFRSTNLQALGLAFWTLSILVA